MKASFFSVVCLVLGGCATSNGMYGEPQTASHVPAALDICVDYRDSVTCFGNKYMLWGDDGKLVTRHEGIDFRAPPGTEVIASSNGNTIYVGWQSCSGGHVFLDTGAKVKNPRTGKDADLYISYHHIVPEVFAGEIVKAGEVIGKVAGPGVDFGTCSSFSHVHFTTRVGHWKKEYHVSPHAYWADGPGIVTCWKEGTSVEQGKIVAPFKC